MSEKVTKGVITPDLSSLIDLRIKNGMSILNCTLIGTVQAFDAVTQTATISVNYKRKVGELFVEYPLLLDCPVVILSGGGGYLTFPVATGDTCIVLFCDRDIDAWFDSGQILAPNSDRIHDLSDGIALVGIRSKLNLIETYNEVRASLIDASGERLSQAGDTKTSFRTANHSGWLIMDGSTVGNADSGADYAGSEYEELFDILKAAEPNAGTEVFGDDDTVIITDMRGRGAVGADNMGGNQANVLSSANQPNRNTLGGEIGEEKHQLTIAELASHFHTWLDRVVGTILSGMDTAGLYSASTTNTSSTGGDEAHNNIPPGVIMYWFIKI
ncbi:MAG: hypothetical protein JRJ39_00310 [Deltaproteobacteria bacterium]|nr:hypothetical protein [Deltaproteobacteria bacterium]